MSDTAETIHADVRHLLRRLGSIADEQLRAGDVKALKSLQKSLMSSINTRSRWLENAREPVTVVRPDDAGLPDDIVIADVDVFRMERMSDCSWWIACYRGGERLVFSILADDEVSQVDCYINEDELGVRDDRGDWSGDDGE